MARRPGGLSGACPLGVYLLWGCLLGAFLLGGCQADKPAPEAGADPLAAARQAGYTVAYVGITDLAEGDTLNADAGLTIIENTIVFPDAAVGAEAFAWEFEARSLKPIKLIVLKPVEEGFELVGESQLVVPRRLGANLMALREPIPVGPKYRYGLLQPEEGVVPFKIVQNWKTLITVKPFPRPLVKRDGFANYGWRYSMRVHWRKMEEE